jgi:hypothetical protein
LIEFRGTVGLKSKVVAAMVAVVITLAMVLTPLVLLIMDLSGKNEY